ncbi:MAG: glycoside hydrolase family 97 catalytic domain-containing protein [Nibricoccus sp.]
MKRLLSIAALTLLLCRALPAHELSSPDGTIEVSLKCGDDGALSYAVRHHGRVVLKPSPLGLETSIGSFSVALSEAGTATVRIDERYTLPHGKVSAVHYVANELTASYKNAKGDLLTVIFRVSDRDVAFAYRVSGPNRFRIVVARELTGFKFPEETTAFVTQQAAAGGGWMGTKPSYEEGYLMDVPVGTKSPVGLGFTFPALFRLRNDGWALISETGVSGNYAGSRLGDPLADGLYPLVFPERAENGGVGDATVSASLPLLTPWRTITIGSTLAPIVETTVATDVVKPLYAPSQTYKPGRAAWSWLLWQDPSMNEPDQRTFIDLAAALGYEYILIDALWDVNIGREKMSGLVAYARSRGVDVLLWYNSNGSWNDAPQTPRDCLDSAHARQREMEWLRSIGVKGLKVDFFGGDKQATMKLYEDMLTDANAHGLMLNFHGATLPRGWERMYPNFMTSEAVTASENLVFSQGFADREAFNSTVFPFVRNPVAAMDYGPVVLNKVLSRDQQRGTVRRTTIAFQLATAVLYQSPLQHFGLTPGNLVEQPPFVVDFLKQVPVAWDETRFVAGYPGRFAVLARRSGKRWYLAATNGEKERREITLSVPYLAGKTVTLIHDRPDREVGSGPVSVGADGHVTLALEAGGGAVLFNQE